MPNRTVTFVANDDQKREWTLPKRSSPHLVIRAVDRWAAEGDEGLAEFGLTKAETEIVAEVTAWLEEHDFKCAVASDTTADEYREIDALVKSRLEEHKAKAEGVA